MVNVRVVGTVAGKWRKRDAVLKGDVADLGGEKRQLAVSPSGSAGDAVPLGKRPLLTLSGVNTVGAVLDIALGVC